ncbi:hypothetical protein Tco_0086518 [Tanacetum coccineum]
MSMLEDRSSYINVSESAQDTDVVNPTHVYYNGSRTSQDKEDPSWSTSIKTRRQRRHLQHWKRLGCHFILLYLYLIGTLHGYAVSSLMEAYRSSEQDEKEISSARGELLGRLLPCHSLPRISSGVFVRGVNRSCRRPALYWLLKSGRLSKLDLGMLSFSFLIRSGLVMSCMNPDILMLSGTLLSLSLLDVMNLYGVLDVLLLLREVSKERFS